MGLGSFLTESFTAPLEKPGDFVRGKVLGGDEAEAAAEQRIGAARDSANLFRDFASILREDAAPLRGLRDRSLTGLVDVIKSGGDFRSSPEYTTVLDAAMGVVPDGATSGLMSALNERAQGIASGQFRPFANRIATQAGVGAGGLNSTNALLQQNIDAQSEILQQAGDDAASGILAQNRDATQTATGIGGLLGSIFSDERLKTNIVEIGQLDNGLNVYQWEWKDDKYKQLPNVGLIAQQVQKVNPEAVTEDEDGLLRVNLFKATGVSEEQLNG